MAFINIRRTSFNAVKACIKDDELNTSTVDGDDKNLLYTGGKAKYIGGGWWKFTSYCMESRYNLMASITTFELFNKSYVVRNCVENTYAYGQGTLSLKAK